jgi:hypothetical protein
MSVTAWRVKLTESQRVAFNNGRAHFTWGPFRVFNRGVICHLSSVICGSLPTQLTQRTIHRPSQMLHTSEGIMRYVISFDVLYHPQDPYTLMSIIT